MKGSGIYKITNLITNNIYIGSAISIKRRWIEHKRDLRGNRHRNSYLQNAWNKYEEKDFKFEIIEIIENAAKEKLIEREQYFIYLYNACDRDYGYNLAVTAGSQLGYKHSNEFREKARARQLGKLPSAETKARMSKSQTDRKRPADIGQKISAAKKGKGLGAIHTKEQIDKRVESSKRTRELNRAKLFENLESPIIWKRPD